MHAGGRPLLSVPGLILITFNSGFYRRITYRKWIKGPNNIRRGILRLQNELLQ